MLHAESNWQWGYLACRKMGYIAYIRLNWQWGYVACRKQLADGLCCMQKDELCCMQKAGLCCMQKVG